MSTVCRVDACISSANNVADRGFKDTDWSQQHLGFKKGMVISITECQRPS